MVYLSPWSLLVSENPTPETRSFLCVFTTVDCPVPVAVIKLCNNPIIPQTNSVLPNILGLKKVAAEK